MSRIYIMSFLIVFLSSILAYSASPRYCKPLDTENAIKLRRTIFYDAEGGSLCNISVCVSDEVKGSLHVNEELIKQQNLKVVALVPGDTVLLRPALHKDSRNCAFISDEPLRADVNYRIVIPKGVLEVWPEYIEVDELDIDAPLLESLSVAGAWHKAGSQKSVSGMFSIVDDDSLDGQIPSSKPSGQTYGYYSILYPLLESLGLKGMLAIEGRRIGITQTPPCLNDNAQTMIRLKNEKGWSLLSHSMDCLGEVLNNWIVDSLDSELAKKILKEGPYKGASAYTVSVYDRQTGRQYWPEADSCGWKLTPERFIKPYVGDYDTKKVIAYNPDFSIDWHWAEWKRRADSLGLYADGFVTHNATSSHAMVPGILKVFPHGFSDLSDLNINYAPMLSTAVRSGLEGQSVAGHKGENTDNTFNNKHFRHFCSQVDRVAESGGWIVFNLHAYRNCWNNYLPGTVVSEGGSYPDEWVIPMKGVDSACDPLSPPSCLGISAWSEWFPCPGTRLEMLWRILKYAKEKGLVNVSCEEGFRMMGNKKTSGYFNNGYRFGMDRGFLSDTRDIYPHYVQSAFGEEYYFNPLVSDEIIADMSDAETIEEIKSDGAGQFYVFGGEVLWSCPDPSGFHLELWDVSGRRIMISPTISIDIKGMPPGTYIVRAINETGFASAVKVAN